VLELIKFYVDDICQTSKCAAMSHASSACSSENYFIKEKKNIKSYKKIKTNTNNKHENEINTY